MAKRIITISREFGSGGRFIGEEVAQQLGIAYYSENIIDQIAQQSGLSPEYIEENAELSPKKGFFAYAFSGRDITGKSVDDMLDEAQRKVILEIAEKLCDRIGILQKGKLIFLGTVQELKDLHPDKSLEEIYLEMIKSHDEVPDEQN